MKQFRLFFNIIKLSPANMVVSSSDFLKITPQISEEFNQQGLNTALYYKSLRMSFLKCITSKLLSTNKKHKIKPIKFKHLSGLSLLELSMTIAISGIMLISIAALVAAAVKVMNYIYNTNQQPDNTRVVLNIITNNLYNNKGNFQVITVNNSTKLSFDLTTSEPSTIQSVDYICDYTNNKFLRTINNLTSELMLNNIENCQFIVREFSNSPNMQVIIKLIYTTIDSPNIYEVINVPKGS